MAPLLAAAGPARAPHWMVVSAQHLATDAGAAMLTAGGNAVDAAVAVGYALAVTDPCCGNIGGGGFLLLRQADGAAHFLDFRETAPAAATAAMYLGADGAPIPRASIDGWRAVAVPGTVAGLDATLSRWGRLTRAQVMAPAIALARDGFVLEDGDAAILAAGAPRFRGDALLARRFLHPDGTPLVAGDRLVQPELAATLARIASDGSSAFYKGPVAEAVGAASRAGGGVLTAADLAGYAVHERAPVRCDWRGLSVIAAPLPSSGGMTLCEILGILGHDDLAALGRGSAMTDHLLIEAMRHAYLDRNTLLGDPDFVTPPTARLLDPAYAARLRASIDPDRATPSASLGQGKPPHEGEQTTHYDVVDHDGMAVSVTYTVNALFGAGVSDGADGFVLNDEMDDFATVPGRPNLFGLIQGEANAVAPGKRPLSSMSPTIVEQGGETKLVLGSPGGSRIITITLETLLGATVFGLDAQAAVDAPRLHHQFLPDVVYAEAGAIAPDVGARLRAMGYAIETQGDWGAAALIVRTKDGWEGAMDRRRPAGSARGG